MSQLYARVFTQILDSSIAEDFTLRHIFEDLLKLCDHRTGVVDMTRWAVARRLNVPLDTLNDAINKLESPDPASRDNEFEGRRIERLDDHRDWGWRILNWNKYDEIRTKAAAAERAARHRDKKRDKEPHSEPKSESEGDCEEIYTIYPKHVGKPKAIVCIKRAITEFGYEHVLSRTRAYAQARAGQDSQFTPLPATWFNQHRFNDDPSTWKQSQPTNSYGPKITTQADAVNRTMREIEQAAERAMNIKI